MSLLVLVQVRRLQLGQMLAGFVCCTELCAVRFAELGIGAGCAGVQGFLVEVAGQNIGLLSLGVQRWGWLG